ncbi:unnamed protein product [Acanthosepion pharaonis]|uniref:Uncharacterized protein n=1 Tax=Acanthosepion pharaonis TaxID=158019 RepID=A0A812D2U3_ACAPH|nr:unnamed protein product [Sepia pharaonis]
MIHSFLRVKHTVSFILDEFFILFHSAEISNFFHSCGMIHSIIRVKSESHSFFPNVLSFFIRLKYPISFILVHFSFSFFHLIFPMSFNHVHFLFTFIDYILSSCSFLINFVTFLFQDISNFFHFSSFFLLFPSVDISNVFQTHLFLFTFIGYF